jgi:hypothetical protein
MTTYERGFGGDLVPVYDRDGVDLSCAMREIAGRSPTPFKITGVIDRYGTTADVTVTRITVSTGEKKMYAAL